MWSPQNIKYRICHSGKLCSAEIWYGDMIGGCRQSKFLFFNTYTEIKIVEGWIDSWPVLGTEVLLGPGCWEMFLPPVSAASYWFSNAQSSPKMASRSTSWESENRGYQSGASVVVCLQNIPSLWKLTFVRSVCLIYNYENNKPGKRPHCIFQTYCYEFHQNLR